jgi:hypothetical protein
MIQNTITTCEECKKGKEIAKSGDFPHIYQTLREQGLMEKCVACMQASYRSFFNEKNFELEEKMWETLTVLGLYDPPTMEHSIRTFSIANDLATKTLLGPRGENVVLKEYVKESGVTFRELLLSALCHDIGKIKIPLEILHNSLTDTDMNRILIDIIRKKEHLDDLEEQLGRTLDELSKKSDEEIISIVYEKGIRPVIILPLTKVFPESKYPGILSTLKERGFSENQTIPSVTKIHEDEGLRIFTYLGEPLIADLVGHHHNYKKEGEAEMKYIMKIPLLKSRGYDAVFGIYNIIKIADSMDSLQSERPYKKGMSKISALAELSHQVLTGRIEKSICYLWVNTEYREIKKTMQESGIVDHNFQDKQAVETIEKFLTEAEQEFDRRLTER